jgi:Serine kinase of the HPr protein, regulates carbohydrate metabolism
MLTADRAVGLVVQQLYGLRIRTPWPVRGLSAGNGPWDVEFVANRPDVLARAASRVPDEQRNRWAQYAALPDGSAYRRWSNLFEFLVTADARHIYAQTLTDVDNEAMLAYLLVDALSFSMVRLGWEPLHATAVATDHGVVGFLGNSGDGKSTLAALLLQQRCKLVTDDMLVLVRDRETWLAQPGPPRLKLYRDMADHILGVAPGRIAMNPDTTKLIVPLDTDDCTAEPHPLRALYVLRSVGEDRSSALRIEQLSPAAAFPRVLAHTAGHYPSEIARLQRQFQFTTTLVREIPVKTLSYPREKAEMARLRDAVLADLSRSSE